VRYPLASLQGRVDTPWTAATGLAALVGSALSALALVGVGAYGQGLPAGAGLRGARPGGCVRLRTADDGGHFIAREDMAPPTAAVDGDDLLALVNRSPRWALAAEYSPSDLVRLDTMQPETAERCVPPERNCLRRAAATAFRAMAAAMRSAGHEPRAHSAYRGYFTQCAVFAKWAWAPATAMGFCPATNASALPGHSQHQLGTALDLFTIQWQRGGNPFREGFGCSPGGRWLAENSWRFGFVLPYPLHPDYRAAGSDCAARREEVGRVDPRTGYKHEPWHLRFIGLENARRFQDARVQSGIGTAGEITLEQWLRARLGASDPIEPPACDGCACEACATFASAGGPCPRGQGLRLGPNGAPEPAQSAPTLVSVRIAREADATLVWATVRVPEQTRTQPPIGDARGLVGYGRGVTARALATRPGALARDYRGIEGAWSLGVEPMNPGSDGPVRWRAALVRAGRDATDNGFNAAIVAAAGEYEVGVRIEGLAPGQSLRVGLVRGEARVDARPVRVP
jgi:D-alanyl-D-alanine carboxypeptidase